MSKDFNFKGTKSRGDSWDSFLNSRHIKPREKDEIFGRLFVKQNDVYWLHIHDVKTGDRIDDSTWGFFECDLFVCDLEAKK